MMTERFNVAGAMLAKLYGRPDEEAAASPSAPAGCATSASPSAMYGSVVPGRARPGRGAGHALVYGMGGVLAVHGAFELGTLVALAALLIRLYGPLTALSNVQVDVMTALVSFDRVFEVLDLKPHGRREAGRPAAARTAPAAVEFDDVSFRYPAAAEVSLASLEAVARADTGAGRRRAARHQLHRPRRGS